MHFFESLLFLSLSFSEPAQFANNDSCCVTYIANEGFLIETTDLKVIVDALFGGINGDWCDQPKDSVVNLILNGLPPFDNIDVVLVSHHHQDHFNESMVIEFLMKNKQSKLICPGQANELLKTIPGYSEISNRIASFDSAIPFDSTLYINNCAVKVFRTSHGSYFEKDSTGKSIDRHGDVQNFGYLVNMKGFNIFHSGDGSPSTNPELYKKYNLGEVEMDVALLDRVFLNRDGQKILTETIHCKNIVLMHIEPSRNDYFRSYVASIPILNVFKHSMESIVFHK